MLLINQKMSNEEFQVTPQEWLANLHKRNLEKWNAYKSGKAQPAASGSITFSVRVESARSVEMKQVITNALNALGADLLTTLADSSLDTLGIPR